MEDFFKDDDFIQYVIINYMAGTELTAEEKIERIFSSAESFFTAMESFRLSNNLVNKH